MSLKKKAAVLLGLLAAVILSVLPLPRAYGEETGLYQETEDTVSFRSISSTYGILVNTDTGEIVARREESTRMYPASMTKVMTVLVAAEHLSNLSDTVEITEDIIEEVSTANAAAVGFQAGERVTVADCLFGTALASGADAALALGRYVAGSDEAFVEMMNEKAEELGLSDTHYENCIGMYDENHYTTVEDMAAVLQAALNDSTAAKALSARQYTTSKTTDHPDGITVRNLFLKRMEKQELPGIVFCAKTGYIQAAGFCAVSALTAEDGTHYICCTGDADSTWSCIYDHAAIYRVYAGTEETGESAEDAALEETVPLEEETPSTND